MAKDFNHPKVVQSYDEHIRKLIPGYELVHLQIQAILKSHLNDRPSILIAGCGTGYELQYLSQQFPQASFVAFDPALEMLEKAKQGIHDQDRLEQTEFLHGDSGVLSKYADQFDAALIILVTHFLDLDTKKKIFKDIYQSLKINGICLSYDLMAFEHAQQIEQLHSLTQALGLSEKQSNSMVERLEDDFHLISMDQMHQVLKLSGFSKVENFSQILNFFGLSAFKSVLPNLKIQ